MQNCQSKDCEKQEGGGDVTRWRYRRQTKVEMSNEQKNDRECNARRKKQKVEKYLFVGSVTTDATRERKQTNKNAQRRNKKGI